MSAISVVSLLLSWISALELFELWLKRGERDTLALAVISAGAMLAISLQLNDKVTF